MNKSGQNVRYPHRPDACVPPERVEGEGPFCKGRTAWYSITWRFTKLLLIHLPKQLAANSFRRKIQDMKKLTILSLTFPVVVVMFLTSCASEQPAAVTTTTTTHEETVQPSAATTTTHQTTTGRY